MKKNKILITCILLFSSSLLFCQKSSENKNEKVQKNSYLGWIDSSAKDISKKEGIVEIKVKPKYGTFNIGAINENDKVIPVLSMANEFTTSSFYLKINKKIYRLFADSNIMVNVNVVDKLVQITYTILNEANVIVNFEIFRSEENVDADMIKVSATITNKSSKRSEYALKMILDTILGETGQYHFLTANDTPIKNEVSYRTMKNQKFILSQNSNACVQILFDGKDITPPEFVGLANFSTLDKDSWEPNMMNFRAFDTVLSYNNSAVGTIWQPVKLAPGESCRIVFYLALSTGENKPNGEKYIFGIDNFDEKEKSIKQIDTFEQNEKINSNVIENPNEKQRIIPNVDFTISDFPKEKLTQDYIQNLIDRITTLEENESSVNREEILRLNSELDAILSVLR